ncbi:hypothetical protein N7466_004717 [Penicillium verhagenii]|uniref:uncharacterized protein n=1 Tax=Penicillium verhagenii TaxID=1562060 RepID=UPI00254551BF|nr:uncharacterized protein N7466_004717 [Penicillium verhagenii]KAJ5935170.1 hypothetical protein N7466_004717 [Penicillium verhagenii]
MGSSGLQLVCPSEHDIYFNLNGDGYSEPLTGALVLQRRALNLESALQMQIHLMQTVLGENSPPATVPEKNFLKRIRTPLGKVPRPEAPATKSSTIIEQVTLPELPVGQLEASFGGRDAVPVPFSVPIPVNTPGTTTTPLGKISYSLIATVTTSQGQTIITENPINITRQLIPDRQCIQHVRSYAKSPAITNIALSQTIATDAKSGISVSAKLYLRRGLASKARDSEFKCATIRGIHWRVEEVTRLVDQTLNNLQDPPEDFYCKRESVREICSGKQKGYWATRDNPLSKQPKSEDQDSAVDITIDISIPKNTKLAPMIDGSCYGSGTTDSISMPLELQDRCPTSHENLAILIEHRLKLEFVTGEDTFDTRSKNLVDRKLPRATLSAHFPLLVGETFKCDFEAIAFSNPPRYEEIPLSPPEYSLPEYQQFI